MRVGCTAGWRSLIDYCCKARAAVLASRGAAGYLRAGESQAGNPRREEGQCLLQFRPGQISAEAAVRSCAKGVELPVPWCGDVEVLAARLLAVGPPGGYGHDRVGRKPRDTAVLDRLGADPPGKWRDRLAPRTSSTALRFSTGCCPIACHWSGCAAKSRSACARACRSRR